VHDLKAIREDPEQFSARMAKRVLRNATSVDADILARDKELRALQGELQRAPARRNESSREIGAARKGGGAVPVLEAEARSLGDADATGGAQVDAVVVGEPSPALLDELAGFGVSTVHALTGEAFASYAGAAWASGLDAVSSGVT